MTALSASFAQARATKGKPSLIVANTLTGAGVPFLEGNLSHLAFLSEEDAVRALEILEGAGA
jgi:transketolase